MQKMVCKWKTKLLVTFSEDSDVLKWLKGLINKFKEFKWNVTFPSEKYNFEPKILATNHKTT
jgi:hypothetical protein